MVKKDKRVDAYFEKAQNFAKSVLKHLRAVVHEACPETEETIKWGVPHFLYRGKILCSMAGFKRHCAFMFRLGSVMKDPKGILSPTGSKSGMGHFGKISGIDDLPADKVLVQYIREAVRLTDQGVKKASVLAEGRELDVPEYFTRALKKDKQAYGNFQAGSYSYKKDYIEWITGAKTVETRSRRIAAALEWLHEGKARNWKYQKH